VQVALRIWVHVTPRIFRTGSETDPASGAGEAGVDPEGGCAWADARRPGVGDIALESLSLGGNCPLVAFIDILGFGREIEAAKSEEDFQRIYKKLHFVQEAFQNSSVAKDPADQTRLNLDYGRKVLALSDTVVLAITANCPAEKTGRNRHHTHPLRRVGEPARLRSVWPSEGHCETAARTDFRMSRGCWPDRAWVPPDR